MGLFGNNKKNSSADGNGDVAYEDMDHIPVAVLVSPDESNTNQKQIVASVKQNAACNTNITRGSRMKKVAPGSNAAPIIFMSRSPTVIPYCPVCMKANVRTRTVTAPDWMTWVTVAVILVSFWPLCWVPLVTDSCRRTIHYCAHCNGEVGTIRPYKDCCVKHR